MYQTFVNGFAFSGVFKIQNGGKFSLATNAQPHIERGQPMFSYFLLLPKLLFAKGGIPPEYATMCANLRMSLNISVRAVPDPPTPPVATPVSYSLSS